jgi:ABC-2 type transport system ATP-binding protein
MLSTHILSEVEMTCERVLVIMRGKLRADSRVAELKTANAAVVAIETAATGVADALKRVAGVETVEKVGEPEEGFDTWRVTASSDDLCPALFEALRRTSWRVAELRSDTRTLESVFRELAQTPDEKKAPAAAAEVQA